MNGGRCCQSGVPSGEAKLILVSTLIMHARETYSIDAVQARPREGCCLSQQELLLQPWRRRTC